MLPDHLIVGTLDAFFETGTEGVIWAVNNNNEDGWAALNILEDGDYLFVEDGYGGIEWEGVVDLDYDIRKAARQSGAMQQEVCGYWVHGLQRGVNPETWGAWFFDNRPAVLRKKDYASITDQPN
jgi:hypothetical protein